MALNWPQYQKGRGRTKFVDEYGTEKQHAEALSQCRGCRYRMSLIAGTTLGSFMYFRARLRHLFSASPGLVLSMLLVLAVSLWTSDLLAEPLTEAPPYCEIRPDWQVGSRECPCKRGWTPTDEQLAEILDKHETWLTGDGKIANANFKRATFCNARLEGRDLSGFDLEHANFRGADMSSNFLGPKTDFSDAILDFADFQDADLTFSNLHGAELRWTNFENANLWGQISNRPSWMVPISRGRT